MRRNAVSLNSRKNVTMKWGWNSSTHCRLFIKGYRRFIYQEAKNKTLSGWCFYRMSYHSRYVFKVFQMIKNSNTLRRILLTKKSLFKMDFTSTKSQYNKFVIWKRFKPEKFPCFTVKTFVKMKIPLLNLATDKVKDFNIKTHITIQNDSQNRKDQTIYLKVYSS